MDHSSPQALAAALRDIVDHIHTGGWDNQPHLFALVPTETYRQLTGDTETGDTPLVAVEQPELPPATHTDQTALAEYLAQIAWPEEVTGAALVQQISVTDPEAPQSTATPARLYSAILNPRGSLVLLQPRQPGDEVVLKAGEGIADDVLTTLRAGFDDTLNASLESED